MKQKGMDYPQFLRWYQKTFDYTKTEMDGYIKKRGNFLQNLYNTVSKYRITSAKLTRLYIEEAKNDDDTFFTLLNIMEKMPLSLELGIKNFRRRAPYLFIDTDFNTIKEFVDNSRPEKQPRGSGYLAMYDDKQQEEYDKNMQNFANFNGVLLKRKLTDSSKYEQSKIVYDKYVKPENQKLRFENKTQEKSYNSVMRNLLVNEEYVGATGLDILMKFNKLGIESSFIFGNYLANKEEEDRFNNALRTIYKQNLEDLKIFEKNLEQENVFVSQDNRVKPKNQAKVLEKKLKRTEMLKEFNKKN